MCRDRAGSIRVKELAPVAKLIDIPIVMVTNAKTGPKTVKEMIERSKSTAGGLSFGTTGANSSQHLAVELLKKMTGANLVHVPYRGSAPAVTAVIGDQIPLASVDLTSGHPHIKAGTLIGARRDQRASEPRPRRKSRPSPKAACRALTDRPDFIGIFAPPGTPAPKIRQLSSEIAADRRQAGRAGQDRLAVGRARL